MRARLAEWYELARSSFWFLPTVMMVVGVLLFAATLTVDELGIRGRWITEILYSGDAAFIPIRNYGRTSVLTGREMLRVIVKLAGVVTREYEREALRRHADVVHAAAEHALTEESDIERMHGYYREAVTAIEAVERRSRSG